MASEQGKPTKQIKIHNTVKIDAKNPVPVTYGGTAFTTINGFQYIPYFSGEDNLFRTLLEARLLSPTHNNCINDKVFYSLGDGLQVQDQDFPTDFDKLINPKRQRLDDVIKSLFDSIYQDGNKFVEIACTEVEGKKFVHAYPHNNMDCRFEEPKDGQDPTHVIRSKQFRRNGIWNFDKEDKPIRIALWNGNPIESGDGWTRDGKVWRTMIHVKNEFEGVDFYGLASSFPGLHNIVLEYKTARFNMDNFDNNWFLGGVLTIEGSMTDPEEKKLIKNLKSMYTGEGRGQRILPISSESGIVNTKFTPFTQQQEGHFIEFDKRNEEKIISANSWSKALLDLKEESGMGKGGEFLKALFKIKFRTVISPVQQNVLNNFVFPLMQIIDEWKKTNFYDLPWIIKPVVPISLEGILDINSLLTVDEGREEIGKKPLGNDKGKQLISEAAAKKKEETEEGTKPKGGAK